ncbi:putative membrane protein C3B8.06 [Psilocybe cubensis]|uniref:Membrane protein C3B8.06 n=2 Tax=Psilocybe cubensis TaxID=181762 RepID=A0ACB8H493_PSICU|nr:putative membrane protein C3B8.06 [Psilocybe cubensis]KAH9482823.1 putative membrane protein C3B8.06 [Psilocybe cubensis]
MLLLRWPSVVPLLCAALCALAVPSPEQPLSLATRDGGAHHHAHGAPLLVLNETEVTLYHSPTPPSYYTLDFEDEGYQQRHKGLMIFHGLFMSLAFFVSLPVGAVHGSQGYLLILVAISLSTLDIIAAIRRFVTFLRSPNKSFNTFWRHVIKKEAINSANSSPEYVGLISEEPDEFTTPKPFRQSVDMHDVELNDMDRNHTEQWAKAIHRHQKTFSMASERTVFGSHSPSNSQDTLHDAKSRTKSLSHFERLQSVGRIVFAIVERALVVGGFAQLLMGIVTYSGGCRENYLNGCLAHLIKGGIFWCYGLLTFARFLGSFADRGWAWNRSLSGDSCTAEFVESFVIFLYGATNTWMERFGAQPGDPFTTKQIQHISIAVMFCFAGLVGMGIESKRIRKWLASSAFSLSSLSDAPQEAVVEPLSYIGSYNPFPALVIGVTGAAMAAHAQTYLFQVQIHSLWGNLLVAFSVLRCLTYFFLWLGPPKSVLPSRPPTEALGSFFLACGGLVFMFSTEEVTIAAMRRGRDDVMMFLNVAVALTCLAFCWTLFVVGFKGWIKSRTQPSVTYRHAA